MEGETITPSLVVETFAMGIEAVLAGIGVGIVPALFVEKELADGTLSMVGPRVDSDGAYYFAYPERRKSHYPLREFVRWIRSESSR
jgi:LysR family glycine cleavage system transcriptional activator